MAEMLKITMDEINNARKGITFAEVKRYLASKFDYHNIPYIKKAVKNGLLSGLFVKTTGRGLSGKFKLATKPKTNRKSSDSVKVEKKKEKVQKEKKTKADKVPKSKKSDEGSSTSKRGRPAKVKKTKVVRFSQFLCSCLNFYQKKFFF